jgi:GNAT superfamily N-acetyltransferase
MKLQIKPVEKGELKILKKEMGDSAPHEHRYKQQLEINSVWLIGWIKNKPVAHIQIKFNGDETKKVIKNLGNCAHLTNLGVIESERGKGFASKMLKFAEKIAREKGFKKTGLSAEYNNDLLKKIYNHCGYKDWGHGTITDMWEEEGKLRRKKCWYFVKELLK